MGKPNDGGVEIPSSADVKDSERSSRSLVISAVVIAVVVIVGITCLVIVRGLNADEREQAQSSSTAEDSTRPIEGADQAPKNGTDLSDRFRAPTTDNQGTRLEVPKDPRGQLLAQGGDKSSFDGLQWQKVLGIAMPFTTAAGPSTMTASGTPSGFARSEEGAALAAWQLQWRLALGPNDLRREILDTSVINDEGFREQQRQAYLAMPDKFSSADTDVLNTVPAYLKVETYDGDVATVSFGALNTAGSEAGMVTTVTVLWREGTWKLLLRGPAGEVQVRDVDNFEGWGQW